MKNFTFTILTLIFSVSSLIAQTGPANIGNFDGSNGQPKNILWLKANDLSLSDGANVILWPDSSGNGNDLDTGAVANSPIFVLNQLNTLPVIRFAAGGPDGNGSRLVRNPFNSFTGNEITTIVVYSTSAGGDGIVSYSTTGDNNEYLLYDNSSLRIFTGGNSRITSQTYNDGQPTILSTKWRNSDNIVNLFRDGTNNYSNTLGTGNVITNGGSMVIGGEQDAVDGGYQNSQAFDGDIAEVIMFDTYLNDAQRIIIENYLNLKYGITIATDGFASGDASYTKSFTGIGQEADGAFSESSSQGLIIANNGALDNGDYVMFAHNGTTNSVVATDVPAGVEDRWAKDWYIEQTGSQNVSLKFDFSEGINGEYPQNISNYVLLYRNTTTGNYAEVTATVNYAEADQVNFDVLAADLLNGYYTIGTKDQTNSPLEGAPGTSWYTLISGDWNDWEVWTLDPSGALPNNPNHLYPNLVSDKVFIKSGKTVTMNVNNIHCNSLDNDGRLDLVSTTGHTFDAISGNGRILMSDDNFPSYTDISGFADVGQDEGTVVYYGSSSYTLSSAHTFYNMEVDLDAGQSITLLNDYTLNGSLTIVQGTLIINDNTATTNLNLNVLQNVVINSNGAIHTGTADARHQFNIYGDFTNNGEAKFTNRTTQTTTSEATDGIVDLNFLNDNSNQTIACNGITNFYRIEIDKGTDKTYILDIQSSDASYFNLFGYANENHAATAQLTSNANALALLKGTVKIGSNVNINTLTDNGNYNISEAARLWVAGGNVYNNNANSLVPYGTIEVSDGLLESKVSSGITIRDNGLIKISGGVINTNVIRTSVLGVGNVGGYVQSGGTVNIINANSSTSSYYHFSMTYPENVFNMSGGTLHVYDARSTNTNEGGIFIASDPENVNVTGGTVIAEIANFANTFKITSKAPFYNLILRNTLDATTDHILDAGTNINGTADADLAAQPLVVLNDLTIEDNCFLDHNGQDITIGAGFTIAENTQKQGTNNYGLLYDTAKPNTLTFNGNTSDTFNIAYNTNDAYELYVWNLTINKTDNSEIVIKSGINKDPTLTTLGSEYYNRILNIQGTIDVQNGTLNQGHQSIRLYADVFVRSTGVLGIYEPGITPLSAYIMLKDDAAGSTDLNTEKGAVLGNFKLNPGSGKSVGLLSDAYIKRIGFWSGMMNLRTYNLKVDYLHKNSTTTNYASNNGSTTEMIYGDANASDGGLSILVTGNGTYTYPVGTTTTLTRYTWLTMTISNFVDSGYIRVVPVDQELRTIDKTGGDHLSYYWHIDNEGFTNLPTVTYLMKYDDSDIDGGNESLYVPGRVLSQDPFTRLKDADKNKVDDANNLITYDTYDGTGTITLEKADYTAGKSNCFLGSVTVFKSIASYSNWDDKNTWDQNKVPTDGSIVIIHGTDRVWGNSIPNAPGAVIFERISTDDPNSETVPRLQFNTAGTFDIGVVSGTGMISLNTGVNPTVIGDFGQFANNDSSFFMYWNNGTSTLSNILQPCPNLMIEGGSDVKIDQTVEVNDNFIIQGGAVVEVLQDMSIGKDLCPGAYSNGTLEFPATGNNVTLTVNGDINYNYFPSRASSTTRKIIIEDASSTLEHKLIVKGNINLGDQTTSVMQLYNTSNTDRCKTILELQNEESDSLYSNSTVIPDLYRIVMNKGTSQADTFSFNNNITVNGATSGIGVKKAIELQNGTLRFNDPSTSIVLTSGDDNFEIPSTAGLQISQGNFTASGNSGILLDGKLTIDGGTLDMSGGDNFIQYSASGSAAIDISSGNLIVGSQVRRATTSDQGILTYNQSGGTVEIGKSAAGQDKRGIFEILNAGSSFTYTGGTFSLSNDYRTNPSTQSFLFNPETLNMATATSIHFGNANTATGKGNFSIYAGKPIKNLIIDNTSTHNPKLTMEVVPMTIEEEITIGLGTELDANGLNLVLNSNFTNNGTFTPNNNNTIFNGTADQTITGVTTFYNLYDSCSNSLIQANDITIANELHLTNGTLDHAGNILHAQGDVYSTINTISSTTTDGLVFDGTEQQQLIGNANYQYLTTDNSSGIIIPTGYDITISGQLKMKQGIFDIGKNLLVITKDATIVEATPFATNNMIQTNVSFTDAGIKKYFPVISSATNFTYPIGSNGKFTPLTFNITTSDIDNTPIRVKAADEIHPTIINDAEAPDPEITDTLNVLKYYWIIDATGASNFSGTATMQAISSDVQVTSPYDATNYITARLLSRASGLFDKYTETDYNENTYELSFTFTNTNDDGLDGDYFAGVDGSSFNGAIPDEVPLYVSNSDGDWTTSTIWTPNSPAGGPKGARVEIKNNVTISSNYKVAYSTAIDNTGKLLINSTFGHRLGNVTGTGTLYLERGDMPAGDYDGFFAADSGTIEFGGTTDYDILSELPSVNNLTVSGTGQRRLPNLELQLLGNLTINGPELKNEHNQGIRIKKDVTFSSGIYTDGTTAPEVKFELNGTNTQTISGAASFTTANSSGIYRFKMNNPAGVNVNTSIDVTNQLDLTGGKINTSSTYPFTITNTSNSAAINGGSNSYVDGPLYKIISNGDLFDFPVGNGNRYGNILISGTTTSGAQTWNAQYFNYSATSDGYDVTTKDATLERVQTDGYWRAMGPASSSATVKIRWDEDSNAPADASDRTLMRMAEWTSAAQWTQVGDVITDNGQTNGYIESNSALNFNEFADGEYFALANDIIPTTKTWLGNTSTWADANNWNPTGIPNYLDDLTIPQTPSGGIDPIIQTTAQSKNLTIEADANLIVNPTFSLSVDGDLTIGTGSMLNIKANASGSASLITKGAIINNGTCNMELYLTKNIYHYISMPNSVTPSSTFETLGGYSNPNWYWYNENSTYDTWNWAWERPASGTLNAAQGYALYIDVDKTYNLAGTFNTGTLSITIKDSGDKQPNSWNLIGNPYPSAINADELINTNAGVFTGTLYFWDDDATNGTGYASSDYATYTLSGVTTGGGGNVSNGYIAPGQSFFVQSSVPSGSFTFNNSMRAGTTANFFKDGLQDSIARVRLFALNSNNDYNEMLVTFLDEATTGYDQLYDGRKVEGNTDVNGNVLISFYSLIGEDKMAVQALPEITSATIVKLGYNVGVAGTQTIHVKEFENLYPEINVYLIDNELDSTINLRVDSTYSFSAPIGRYNNRFELKFEAPQNETTTWTGLKSGSWDNNSSWDNGVPSPFKTAIVPSGSVIANTDVAFKDLIIQSGAAVTFESGISADIHGQLILESDENGTAAFVDKGEHSIQTGIVKSYLAQQNRYYYLSSPVAKAYSSLFASNEELNGTGAVEFKLYYYDNAWQRITDGYKELSPFTGYAAQFMEMNNATYLFEGVLNTGIQSINLTNTGFNLIGNPYPSPIDWGFESSVGWTNVDKLMSTIWYRVGGSGGANGGGNFATYNRLSGIGTNNGTSIIPTTQAFWVYVNEAATISVDNTARTAESTKIYKTSTSTQGIRLKFANAISSDETVLFENPNAKESFEDYDSQKMLSTNSDDAQLYTYSSDNVQLAANGIPEIYDDYSIELDLMANKAGDYTLSYEMVNAFADKKLDVYLENTITSESTKLEVGIPISLHFDENPTEGTFVLRFKKSATGIETLSKGFKVYSANKIITIENPQLIDTKVEIFDISGKLILSKDLNSSKSTYSLKQTGVYFVRLRNENKLFGNHKIEIK